MSTFFHPVEAVSEQRPQNDVTVESATLRAQLVHVRRCTLRSCSLRSSCFPQAHLSVTKTIAELTTSNATAISYAWGLTARRSHVLGHFDDGSAVIMELGDEWKTTDLINSLAELSEDQDRLLWVDQLCINQENDDQVRQALAKIPLVFRALHVTVLLPRGLCPCWSQLFALRSAESVALRYDTVTLERGAERESVEVKNARLAAIGCAASLSLGHHFARLWPRQELRYAPTIAVHYVSSPYRCGPLKPPAGEQLLDGSRPDTPVHAGADGDKLPTEHQSFPRLEQISRMNSHYTVFWDRKPQVPGAAPYTMFDDFLSGKMLEANSEYIRKGSGVLMPNLDILRLSEFKATDVKDYVLSVFVDSETYVIPKNFRDMTTCELADDALLQLARDYGSNPGVTLPAGLFGAGRQTGLWKPSLYLRDAHIRHSRDLYGALGSPMWLVGTASLGGLLIEKLRKAEGAEIVDPEYLLMPCWLSNAASLQPRLSKCIPFQALCMSMRLDQLNTEYGFSDSLKGMALIWTTILRSWPVEVIKTCGTYMESEKFDEASPYHMAPFIEGAFCFIDSIRDGRNDPDLHSIIAWHLRELLVSGELESSFVFIICTLLGIRLETFWELKLQMVIDPGDETQGPRIGCVGSHVVLGGSLTSMSVEVDDYNVDTGSDTSLCLAYEAVKSDWEAVEDSRPLYEVIGVWLPSERRRDEKYRVEPPCGFIV